MEDNNLRNALLELSRSASRSKASHLRQLFDEVMNLKALGFTHSQIIKVMEKNGLEFNLKTFELTLYRIKKESNKRKAKQMQAKTVVLIEPNSTSQALQEITKSDKTQLPKTGFHRVVDALTANNITKDPRRSDE